MKEVKLLGAFFRLRLVFADLLAASLEDGAEDTEVEAGDSAMAYSVWG